MALLLFEPNPGEQSTYTARRMRIERGFFVACA